MSTSLSRFRKFIGLMVFLIATHLPLSSQAQELSSAVWCDLAANSPGGTCTVIDKNDPNFGALFEDAVIVALISTIQPTITGVSPQQLPQGSTADIMMTSSNTHFNSSSLNGITIGCGIVVNSGVAVVSPNIVVANVTVPVGTALGSCDIKVETNLDGGQKETVTGRKLFVTAPTATPKVLSISPVNVYKKSSNVTLTLSGQNTHFDSSSRIDFSDTAITVVSKTVPSATVLKVVVNVGETAKSNFHKVTVTTGTEVANDVSTLLGTLQVFEPSTIATTPKLTTVQPWQGRQWETVTVSITGQDTNFANGASTVSLSGTGVEVVSTTVSSATQATVTLKVANNAPLGFRDVYVTTGAEIATLAGGFAVFSPATISLDKLQGKPGETVTVSITGVGTHFASGQTTLNFDRYEGITVSPSFITVNSATSATATLQIASTATGSRNLSVVTGGEVAVPSTGIVFEIIPVIRVDYLSPKEAIQGQTVTSALIAINTHFTTATPMVKFSGTGITVKSATATSDTNLSLSLELAANAPVGMQGITVTTGSEVATLANAFTVLDTPKVDLSVIVTGSGRVTSSVTGIDCSNSLTACTAKFVKDSSLILTATPTETSTFAGWLGVGDCSGSSTAVGVTLNASKTCEAKFVVIEYQLTLKTVGNGKIISNFMGSDCGTGCQKILKGTPITLVAVPDTGSIFKSWSGDCVGTDAQTTLTITDNKTCTATFEIFEIVALTTSVEGKGTVTFQTTGGKVCNPSSDACQSYPKGSEAKLLASADDGWTFKEWQGDCQDLENPAKVTMDEGKSCQAVFEEVSYDLQVNTEGNGEVTVAPLGTACDSGRTGCQRYPSDETVTLKAIAKSGWEFTGWSGNCEADTTNSTVAVSLSKNKTCTATFIKIETEDKTLDKTLSIEVSGKGQVASQPAGIDCSDSCQTKFSNNTEVTLTATPTDADSRFVNWQEDCQGSENPTKVTMETDKKCQAVFADITKYLLQVNVTGTGQMVSEPAGIDCSDSCQIQYSNNNTEVTLTATATDANSSFVKWEGACEGLENLAKVTMDKDKECQAVFAIVEPPLLQLQVNIIGTGNVTSDLAGIACLGNAESGTSGQCSYAYSVGQTVTLIADPANTFIGWEGDCKGLSVSTTVTIDADKTKTCAAKFDIIIPPDQDGDSINNDLENAAPNNGDGNDDDTLDSKQANVVSIQRSDGQYLTLEVQPATCQFQTVRMIEQKDLPLDAAYNFPYGLVSFELTQCGQVKPTVTEYYHGLTEVPKGAVYRHYDSTTGQWQELPAATFEPDKIAKQSVVTVTLAMTDAKGDGNMTSQGGIAIKLPPSQIQFTQASLTENEYGEVSTTLPSGQEVKGHLVTIGLTRQNANQGEVGVSYSIAGTATIGQDFVILSPLDNHLTWVDGDTADKSILVFIIDDTEVEGESPEELKLQLTSPMGNAELGTPNEVVVTIQDDSPCTPDPTLALSPEQQTVTLKLAEGQKVLTFSGGQGEVKLKTPPDSSIVEANVSQFGSVLFDKRASSIDFCELAENTGSASCVVIDKNETVTLTLTPRQAGKTQLVLEDCAGHQATVNIEVEDVVVNKCLDSPAFEPATRNITLGIADQPLTLTFKGGQGRVMPTTMPNEEIISLKLPIYADAETKTTQLELVPRTLGETQLTLGDECNHTAEIKIEVINHPECQADEKLDFQPSTQTITFMETEELLSLFIKGGQGTIKLQEVPDPKTVTVDLPFYTEAGLTQLKLTPRQPGNTHLSLIDCAGHQASVEIKVLKPGTLAALCWLDMKEDGLCQLPNNEKVLNPNVSAINADGKPVEEIDARMEINLQSTSSGNLVLLPSDKLTASVNIASAMLKGQSAELIVALARRGMNGAAGEFWMLKELTTATTIPKDPLTVTGGETTESDSPSSTEPADNEESSEDEATEPSTTSDDSTATTDKEDTDHDDSPSDTETTPGDEISSTVDCNDAAMIDYYILTGLCPSPRTKRASVSTAWQSWDGNPANLVAAGQIDTLPAILAQSFELNLSGFSAGEYTLYVGYRLPDGTIIFNGVNGKSQPRFWIANSRSFGTETKVETRGYFDLQTQTTDTGEMKVMATITPDYGHLGQIVDMVMVAVYPTAEGMLSYMRLPNKTWQPWDFQAEMLVPALKKVTLSDSLTVEVFQGSLAGILGTMQVFVGYELTDGTIVFGQILTALDLTTF